VSGAPTTVTELHKAGEADARRAGAARPASVESVIAAELTIEGKISGSGDVRIAGRFKGDVQVDGNFRIDAGARLEGQVRAGVVITVAAGSRMRGHVEFGWEDKLGAVEFKGAPRSV
jgi:hypothetical protein